VEPAEEVVELAEEVVELVEEAVEEAVEEVAVEEVAVEVEVAMSDKIQVLYQQKGLVYLKPGTFLYRSDYHNLYFAHNQS
jgi:hypothetical protein